MSNSKKLVIVESPAKAKKIQSYLGSDYIVKASIGHVRDLPQREMGVDMVTFKPTYVIIPGKGSVVVGLKKAAEQCDFVYICTDPDREGEAIAWHLVALLKPTKYARAAFHEITKKAVEKALLDASSINMKMVAAQETRRVIDRLVGYQISPLLTKASGSGKSLSAGRVQSVALRIVCDNHNEIDQFKTKPHYKVIASFSGDLNWVAEWDFKPLMGSVIEEHNNDVDNDVDKNNEPSLVEDKNIWCNKEKAQALIDSIKEHPIFTVQSNNKKQSNSMPPSSFTTSLLQQAASNTLNFTTSKTMQIAQKLFEEGLITYHRTDNKNLSSGSITEIRQWIKLWQEKNNYPNLIPSKPHLWKNTGDAQEAHEAIRPTDLNNMGGQIRDEDQKKLYRFIWKRAIASQMIPASYDVTTCRLLSDGILDGQQQPFIAKGRILLEAGWKRLTGSDQSKEDEEDIRKDQLLPLLNKSDRISSSNCELKSLTTKPLARLTEASLVRTLEKKGVGRPSTFASIIATILKHLYVSIEKKKFYPTKLGIQVCNGLVGNFSFLEIPFTAGIEKKMDLIVQGKLRYKEVVTEQQTCLIKEMAQFQQKKITINTGQKVHNCPKCKDGKLVRRINKKRKAFYACNNYPECKEIYPEKGGKPDIDWQPAVASEYDCPKCKTHKLVLINGKYSKFFACENRSCKHVMNEKDGKPIAKVKSTEASEYDCPKCKKKKLVLRNGKNGKFFGCEDFKKCKFTCNIDDNGVPVLEKNVV